MPKYARYDHAAPSPQPVIGWYDTDSLNYPSMPSNEDLVVVPDDQWPERFDKTFVSGGIIVAPPAQTNEQQLLSAQRSALGMLYSSYLTAIGQPVPFTSAGGVVQTYQADQHSIDNLQAMLAAFTPAGHPPAGFYWVTQDNTKVPFLLEDMQGLASVIGNQGWAAFQNLQAKKAVIGAATTVADVQAVTW